MTNDLAKKIESRLDRVWSRLVIVSGEHIKIALVKTPSIIMLEISGQKPGNAYMTPLAYTSLIELKQMLDAMFEKNELLSALKVIEDKNTSGERVRVLSLDDL